MKTLRIFGALFALLVLLCLAGGGAMLYFFWHFGRGLPDYEQLAEYQPPITTRLHAGDGRLIAEYARERRLFVAIDAIPKRVIDAFLAAEDKNFYAHAGIDPIGVMRAVFQNIEKIGQSRRPVGASTITQQVAKNFLLTNEVSFTRKAKEAILAFRIERALSKNQILELYLNEIYLGLGAYGVASASLAYFDKPMDDLTIAEVALLAAMPKAPSNYHPARFPDRAKARRDYVIDRMLEDGHISNAEAIEARSAPLREITRSDDLQARSEWFSEEVRRQLYARFGEKGLYEGGLSVRSSMDPQLQAIGEKALRAGLISYDRRHGWRGPIAHIETGPGWHERLKAIQAPGVSEPWRLAVVGQVDATGAELGFADGSHGRLPFEEMRWARPTQPEQTLGATPQKPSDVVEAGDVVAVEALAGNGRMFGLRQVPNVGGALVAMDPHTGRVLALVGGFDPVLSQFNRATQALRQPGSSFKPFVYAAALDNGFTPSSLVLDAPFVYDQGPGLPLWKPANYSHDFLGPTTLRVGLEKSRNLMTVRLAQAIGMDKVVDYATRFGVVDNLPPMLSYSLGAGETTLMRMTAAYAQFVNGGKRIQPTLIDRIQDRTGRTIYRHDQRTCPDCTASVWSGQEEPLLPDNRPQIIDPTTAYQIVSILQGVVERGTGARINELQKPLAGKTGTSNDSNDNWFVGFSADLAVGVFIGFDAPRTLGGRETGASTGVPVFKDFMADALKNRPAPPFRVPPGIRLVRVNPETGRLAGQGERKVILEAFKPGTEPGSSEDERRVLGGGEERAAISGVGGSSSTTPQSGTGGLY